MIVFLVLLIILLSFSLPNLVRAEKDIKFLLPLVLEHGTYPFKYSSIGPDGGTVECVVADPRNSDNLFAGTWGNGIYKSTDGGQTWTAINTGLRAGFIFDIAIDPNNSAHLLTTAYRFGVYETFNSGETWNHTSRMKEGTIVYSLEFDEKNPKNVYAGVRHPTYYDTNNEPHYPGGVYRSTDGGTNWELKRAGLPDDYVYDVTVDPSNSSILYVAMHKTGVYRSLNRGESWSTMSGNLPHLDIRSVVVNPSTLDIYAGMYDGEGVALLKYGSPSWEIIDSSAQKNLSIYGIKLDPADHKTLYLSTSSGLYACGGDAFPSKSSSCKLLAHENQYVFDVVLARQTPAGKTLYTGVEYLGLYKSTNSGTSFEPSYTGIKSNVIVSIVNDPEKPAVLYTSAYGRGVFKSTDGGENWSACANGLTTRYINQLVMRPKNSSVIYAGTQSDGIFISEDSGSTWRAINGGINLLPAAMNDGSRGDGMPAMDHSPGGYSWMDPVDREEVFSVTTDAVPDLPAAYPEILSIGINPDYPQYMVAGTARDGVLKSENYGSSWKSSRLTFGAIYDFLVDTSQPVNIYFAGFSDFGVRASDSQRITWLEMNTGLPYGAHVYALAASGPGKYYAASDKGIYRTNTAGQTWWGIGLTQIRFNDIFIDPNPPQTIWAASSDGLYVSLDDGLHWFRLGQENLNDSFLTMSQGDDTATLYIGLDGGNIYRIE